MALSLTGNAAGLTHGFGYPKPRSLPLRSPNATVSSFSIPTAATSFAAAAAASGFAVDPHWVLADGEWDDTGTWDDTQTWTD